ncbi:hypothetical protein [Leptolyngbya sp. BL0902]|uniref:hypothetical protein n=1 Tax=Leptolyngbya sp. BL0902 TaxID=1115757 RepID=UPI0018E74DFC|nr:hypothetical protein [Leptolyngbya sp. BL0902]
MEMVERELQARASALYSLESLRNALLKASLDPTATERLEAIEFGNLQSRIREELQVLSKLKSRFARDTLNIGVVGLMGQGKSTLLKSLSCLTDREIPAYEGAACTAVRSLVTNREGSVEVKVAFHSEQTFLEEVIHPYYRALNLEPLPHSIDEFEHAALPDQMPTRATDEAVYKHLKHDYHQNLSHYRHLLSFGAEPQERSIPIDEVPTYVRQERNAHGDLESFKHLAVREVKIFCPFGNTDVGKVALVDIPGLGDSKLGDETVMLETLGKTVDVVIFLTRPDPQRYQWRKIDTDLYDTAAQALNNLSGRAFMVINHSRRTNNLKACKALKETLKMKVVSCQIADCANPEDANQVFDEVLNYLADNILNIDEEYARQCQDRLTAIQSNINEIVQAAQKVFWCIDGDPVRAIADTFEDLFGTDRDGWWKEITIAFQKLRLEFAKQAKQPADGLQDGIDDVYATCKEEAGILSVADPEAEIQEQIKASNPMKAYGDYRDQLRTLLSDHFSALDEGLQATTEALKEDVADVLTTVGGLDALTRSTGGSDFIRELRVMIERDHPNLQRLQLGLAIVDDFELSYNGLIEPQIYQHLIRLSNIQLEGDEDADVTLKVGPGTTAELIYTALQVDYNRTAARIKAALEELVYQPNIAAYARIEKFIDNIIYHKDAQKDWKKFLRRVQTKIWPEEMGRLEQENTRQQNWLTCVSRLEGANRKDTIVFLNWQEF